MVTIPISFQYKDVKTHGIVSDESDRKGVDQSWIKAVSGDRAEQRIFDMIQRQFTDKPCLLMSGFTEQDLIKVAKSKLKQDGKVRGIIHLSDQVTRQSSGTL